MSNFRLGLYRQTAKKLGKLIFPQMMPGRKDASPIRVVPRSGKQRIWFHGASAGELESLASVVLAMGERTPNPVELILTVFSESGMPGLGKLAVRLQSNGATVLFHGYSPTEGNWAESLAKAQPNRFVTAKYEAWPELWHSLAEFGISLVIVSARARGSLRAAKRVCAWLGSPLPRTTFLVDDENEVSALKRDFPDAEVQWAGEPRWDRVQARIAAGSERAKSLLEQFANCPRPWGVLAQVWPADMAIWHGLVYGAPGSARFPGTLWIVPHDTRTPLGGSENFSRPSRGGDPSRILIDEQGFLLELYAAMDWAYVGGGFGRGIHSTIEPAAHGIAVSVGPAGVEKFSETRALRRTGQLSVFEKAADFAGWAAGAASVTAARRDGWRDDFKARLGATARIVACIDRAQSAC